MVLLNLAWGKLFAWTEKNRNAISDCVLNPLNRNLLCLQDILGTMAEENKRLEESIKYVMKNGKSEDSATNTTPIYGKYHSPQESEQITTFN